MTLCAIRTSDAASESLFAALERRRLAAQGLDPAREASVRRSVEEIVQAVRERGDAALVEFTERFDGVRLTPERLRVGEDEVDAALAALPADLARALRKAAERILRFQESILLRDPAPVRDGGRTLALRYRPVESAGICVPGASASLASTVLMGVVPARAAGVRRIAVITPPGRDGTVSPDRLAAARIGGATEIYRVFGAQGVAALAFGTASIPRVDFIAGPGNAYVLAAKKAVFGQVGIDQLAGPSEVAIIADRSARPDWVAAEMLSQAEHHQGAATLLTDCEGLAAGVAPELDRQLASLPRGEEARGCLETLGAIVLARSLDECADISDRIAPEHLVLMTERPEETLPKVHHAGAIFLGSCSPVAVGDYIAGPSHCLPTGRTARFSSGLSANCFLKGSSLIRYDRAALAEDAEALCRIADAERLPAHARSVRMRLEP